MKRADGVQKAQLFFDRFEAIAEAAVVAMFEVDGRIEETASAKIDVFEFTVKPTKQFKAAFRRELKARNFEIWKKHRRWK